MKQNGTAAAGPSRGAMILAWMAVGLCLLLLVMGISMYGLSFEVQHRFWADLFERTEGPMTFRFYLQPTMAALAALHDGIKDARRGHTSFFWTAWFDPAAHTGRLREGLIAVARIVLLGLIMDMLYQYRVIKQFYPAEAVVITLLLAVLPYFVFRWIVEGVARWWFTRQAPTRSGG